jgi:large subunit ribosomal protein L17
MHRHGYKGRKFGRERDQRNALMRGLTRSLFVYTSIETTLEKAKDLRPMAEKLITKARKGGLANRRAIYAALGNDIEVGNRLMDVIAPQLKRESGYLRIVRSDKLRVGDNAEIVRIEFVDSIKDEAPAAKVDAKPAKATEKSEKPAAKPTEKSDKSDQKGAK